jgi:hypothetical protein
MLLSPVGEFVSELQTSETPEGIMKHTVYEMGMSLLCTFSLMLHLRNYV